MSTIKIYSPDNLTEELATVKVASSCSRSEKINGENILSFAIPVKNPASTHINEVNVIGIDGDFFDIAAYAKQQNGAGLRMADVECEHVSYRLNDPEFNLEFFTNSSSLLTTGRTMPVFRFFTLSLLIVRTVFLLCLLFRPLRCISHRQTPSVLESGN